MRKESLILLTAVTLLGSDLAAADDKMFVQLPAVVDAAAKIDQDIQEECKLPTLVGEQIFKRLKESNPGTVELPNPSAPGSERFIRLRITTATVVRPVEARRLVVVGEIVQENRVLVSNTFRDSTLAMPDPKYNLTLCQVMEHIADAIGRKVARWAPLPYSKAVLPAQ